MKKQLTIALLLITTLAGCALAQAELTDAETRQIEAVTEQAETDAQAETNKALLDELRRTREADRETVEALLDILKEREKKTPPWVVGLAVMVLGIGGAVYFKRRQVERIVYVLQPGAQAAGLLERGQWQVELPTRREVEVGRE